MKHERSKHFQKVLLLLLLSSAFFISCNWLGYKNVSKPISIVIQPLACKDTILILSLKNEIETYYHFNVTILPNKPFPSEAYYKPRKRYKADILISWLKANKPADADYIIGITESDISTKKESIPDFGIMGLGYRPGVSCVVSTFRIKTKNKALFKERLAKIALHEIGHNLGLQHCNTKTCFMHAAEASIKQIDSEQLDLCMNCKKKINLKDKNKKTGV